MAKKKSKLKKLKLNKKQRLLLHKIIIPVATGLACLLFGVFATQLVISRRQPANLVWASEKSVKVPKDLRKFLESKDDCKSYRGTDTPTGVGLWGVYQTSHDKFAKIAYGCSWNLSSYIMAVKDKSGWKLLPPTEYFAPFENTSSAGALPFCTFIDTYQIDSSIEPFCIDVGGAARTNTIK